MTRRQAIKTAALVTVAASTLPDVVAQGLTDWALKGLKNGSHPFKLPSLPYTFGALEPHIDRRTMEVHHDNTHAAYVTHLNKDLSHDIQYYADLERTFGTNLSDAASKLVEHMIRDLNAVPEKIRDAVRKDCGGHYNHSLFWRMMNKNGGGEPHGELAVAINRTFGGFAAFKDMFSKAATTVSGSGWAWLTYGVGKLKVETTQDEDTPLSAAREILLGIDVWEHAYYRQYQNRRADYVAAWWNVVNWNFVAQRFAALKG